jgi:hypothetical protein
MERRVPEARSPAYVETTKAWRDQACRRETAPVVGIAGAECDEAGDKRGGRGESTAPARLMTPASRSGGGRPRFESAEILAVDPRLRGAEIVSPLKGDGAVVAPPSLAADATSVRFEVTAGANVKDVAPAMQGLLLRVRDLR